MKKFTLMLVALVVSVFSIFADDDNHQLTNTTVSIPATKFKSSRFLDEHTYSGKEYIYDKSSSDNKSGEATTGRALMPYAEYKISSKLSGGDYVITVHYRIDKDKMPDNPKILLGMDLLEPQELEVERKLINTVRATFNTKLLKGKKHTLKIWLPSEGVEIQKFEVRRAIITKKK